MPRLLIAPGSISLDGIATPPPLDPSQVLLKTISVLIDGVEYAVYQGLVWPRGVHAAGFSGYGRIVKRGVSVDGYKEGDHVIISRYVRGHLPVLEAEGWAASYTSVEAGLVSRIDIGACSDRAACGIAPQAGIFVPSLAYSPGRVCILGCGVSGLSTALYASQRGIDYRLYCAGAQRAASKLGLEARRLDAIDACDTMVVSIIDGRVYEILAQAMVQRVILHPVYHYYMPPVPRGARVEVASEASIPWGLEAARALLEERIVRIVEGLRIGGWSGQPTVLLLHAEHP